LAGFCDYGQVDEIGEAAHAQFLSLHDAQHDGHAAQHGFRTGDLVVGIETCRLADESNADSGVLRQWRAVSPDMADEDWMEAAQSCEWLAPGERTKLRVRRAVGS
jgi:hypothetical protein